MSNASSSSHSKSATNENTSQAGKSDGYSTTDHVAQAAHEAVDKAASNLAHAEAALRDAQKAAGVKVGNAAAQAGQMSQESVSAIKRYVNHNPVQSVGIAFATGYLLSVLLKKS